MRVVIALLFIVFGATAGWSSTDYVVREDVGSTSGKETDVSIEVFCKKNHGHGKTILDNNQKMTVEEYCKTKAPKNTPIPIACPTEEGFTAVHSTNSHTFRVRVPRFQKTSAKNATKFQFLEKKDFCDGRKFNTDRTCKMEIRLESVTTRVMD